MMQDTILFLLASFARAIVDFHKPKIIGITGTVGKTTVTAHVYAYISRTLGAENVAYSANHYNGEYGLPLTIIGAKTGGKNPFKWLWVFIVALSRFFRPYPKFLVLEYGIDHPGEMDFLLSIALPDIAIITEISPNHIEQFGNFDAYKREKLKIVQKARDLIIHDSLRNSIEREAWYYGTGAMSEIDVSHISLTHTGTSARVHFQHREYAISVGAVGVFHIVNLLPLYGIAELWNMPIEDISDYALHARGEAGRSSMLDGIHNSTIIDGTYNGGYLSLHSGITTMQSFVSSHTLIFLIGDMRELGTETESLHRQLAQEIVDIFSHQMDDVYFYLVGPHMTEYVLPILKGRVHAEAFLSSRDAGQASKDILNKNHTKPAMIYAKGSQNTIFLEEAVEMLLANTSDVSMLCRQTPEWRDKKRKFFDSLK